MKSYLVASTKKSSGKTIITTGLCSAIKSNHNSISVFKKGPDYIDPLWLSRAVKSNCYNLDFYTMSHHEILQLFKTSSQNSSITITEGNKGLFDGLSLNGSDSNASLAKLLKLEVILVIDCIGITRGIAPLLNGYENFDKKVKYKGIILNNIASDRHEIKIINAIKEYTNLKVLGSVHRNPCLDIKEQHLGLQPVFQNNSANKIIKSISSVIKSSIDIKSLLPDKPKNIIAKKSSKIIINSKYKNLKIGIAKDDAFGFYYADDIEKIRSYGVKVKYFDTIKDKSLPVVDGIIIGGGFPELVAEKLSKNLKMKELIKDFIESNKPVYAECGGLMYLSKSIKFRSKNYKMAGVIKGEVSMNSKPIGRGYVNIRSKKKHPWMKEDIIIKAHEFHYSQIKLNQKYNYAYEVQRGYGVNNKYDGIIHKNLLASYSHLRDTKGSKWVLNFLKFIMANKNEAKTNI